MSELRRILIYALLAGLSPLTLLSTLAVLGSGRGRANGFAFGSGFLLAQSAVIVVAFFVGSAAAPNRDWSHEDLTAALELVLGLALLALAWKGRHQRAPSEAAGESRTQKLLTGLRGLGPVTAFSIGALLGGVGLKRLMITLLAGASIAVAGLNLAEDVGLIILYVLIASLLVWLPVGVYLVAGRRADKWASRAETWLVENQQRATFVSTLVFAVLLCGDAIVRLS